MSFDFKKEYREFYLPKAKPEIVAVPRAKTISPYAGGVTQTRKTARISAPSVYFTPWPTRSR